MLEFDLSSNKFVFTSANSKRLRKFHFTFKFVTFLVWSLLEFWMIIWKGVFHPESISLEHLILALFLLPLLFICNEINYCLLESGDELSVYLNYLLDLRKKYQVSSETKQQTLVDMIRMEIQKYRHSDTRENVEHDILLPALLYKIKVCFINFSSVSHLCCLLSEIVKRMTVESR